MKFSKEFNKILENFNRINPGMVFVPGLIQTTVSNMYKDNFTFLARANTNVEFVDKFGIDNISKLLDILSIFSQPEIILDNKRLIISENGNEVVLPTCHVDFIKHEPNPDRFRIPTDGYKFQVSNDTLTNTLKLAATLGHEYITFGADGEHFYISSLDVDNPTTSSSKFQLAETNSNFKVVFEKKVFNIMKFNYDIIVSKRNFIYLSNSDKSVEYFMTVLSGHSQFKD